MRAFECAVQGSLLRTALEAADVPGEVMPQGVSLVV